MGVLLKNRLSFCVALSAFLAIFGVGGAMAWANDGLPCFDLLFPSVLGTGEGGDREWRLQTYRGSPDLRVDRLMDQNMLRLAGCGKTAFGLKREVEVDAVLFSNGGGRRTGFRREGIFVWPSGMIRRSSSM